MTAGAHDTTTDTTPAAARPARRADAGTIRVSQRDIDGLLLVGEHYGAPADQPAAGRADHVPDAEIHWPSIAGSPYAGQVWAVEVELTPKPMARTARIMGGLLSPMWYAQVIYLTAPAAGPVVTRAAASVHEGDRARVVVRELPPFALGPEVSQ